MTKPFYFAAGAVALLVLGLIILKPGSTPINNTVNNTATTSSQTVPVISEDKFNVTITGGKNAAGAQTYTTTEGRTVRFTVTSNRTGKFDVHGYTQNKIDLPAGQAVELSFTADKTGRFELEFHPEQGDEAVIGALEVNPK